MKKMRRIEHANVSNFLQTFLFSSLFSAPFRSMHFAKLRLSSAFTQIARDRKAGGDEAFTAGKLLKAHSKYTVALAKAKRCYYNETTMCQAIRECLAVTFSGLKDYSSALRWADEVLAEFRPFHRPNPKLHAVYWAKGVALEGLGQTEQAIDTLVAAALLNENCEDTRLRIASLVCKDFLEPLDNTVDLGGLLM